MQWLGRIFGIQRRKAEADDHSRAENVGGGASAPLSYRQGDVLLVARPLEFFGKRLSHEQGRVGSGILAMGEATGHKHVVVGGLLYEDDEGMFVEVEDGVPATIEHQKEDGAWTGEHGPIRIEPGLYEVRRQREWTEEDERKWRLVQD